MDVQFASGLMILAVQDGVGGVVGADPGATQGGQTGELAPDGAPIGGPQNAAPNPFGSMMFPLLLGFLVLMVVTTMMSGRREKREKKSLMESLGKHDKVQLSGGMIGTITEVKPDEVVVRVDESTKTTIRFVKSAVVRVIRSSSHAETSTDEIEEASVETSAV